MTVSIFELCKEILENEFDFEIKSFKFLYKLVESGIGDLDIDIQLDLIIANKDTYEFSQFLAMLTDSQFMKVISRVQTSDFSVLKRCIELLGDGFDMSGYGSLVSKNMDFEFLGKLSAQQMNQILESLNITEELFDFLISKFGDDLEIYLMRKYILSKQGFVISMPKLLNSLSEKHLRDVHDKITFTNCLVGPSVILEKMGDSADVSMFVDAFNNEADDYKAGEFLKKCSQKQLAIIQSRCYMRYITVQKKMQE